MSVTVFTGEDLEAAKLTAVAWVVDGYEKDKRKVYSSIKLYGIEYEQVSGAVVLDDGLHNAHVIMVVDHPMSKMMKLAHMMYYQSRKRKLDLALVLKYKDKSLLSICDKRYDCRMIKEGKRVECHITGKDSRTMDIEYDSEKYLPYIQSDLQAALKALYPIKAK